MKSGSTPAAKAIIRLTTLLFMLVLLALGGPVCAHADVTISRKSATIKIGSSITLSVKDNGQTAAGVVWGSSDTSVATVTQKGKVTGHLKGSAVITAMYQGTTLECIVSVVKNTDTGTVRYNVLVLDHSNSMKGSPMTQVRTAAKRFAKTVLNADGTNYVAVISFGTKSEVICTFTKSYQKAAKAISGITATGHTNMRASFDQAFKLLKDVSSGKNVIKNVILCSDGLPERGTVQTSGRYSKKDHKTFKYANAVYKVDTQMKNEGYFIYALGFFHNSSGKDLVFGKRLMKDLASKDKFYIIQEPDDLPDAFNDIADTIVSLTLSDSSITMTVGDTRTIRAYLNSTAVKAAEVTWSSDNSKIASVDKNGKITAVSKGETTIRASVNGKTAVCKVTVKEKPTTIKLNKSTMTLYVGDTGSLKATTTGPDFPVSWKSSNSKIATVSGSGKTVTVKGVKAGKCTVTATCNGKSASCTVTVKALKDITKGFTLYGNAVELQDGSIRLTECKTWQGGSAWYPEKFRTTKGLQITFQYWAGGGRSQSYGGADGIVLCFSQSTGIGAQGGDIGFKGQYGVEFDSFYNSENKDPQGKHIAILGNSIKNHLTYVMDQRVDDSSWHSVKVLYKSETLSVYLDGKKILTQKSVTMGDNIYLGISGATGSGINEHRFREFKVAAY